MKINNTRTNKEFELTEQESAEYRCISGLKTFFGVPKTTTTRQLEEFLGIEPFREFVIKMFNIHFFRALYTKTNGDNDKFIIQVEARLCGSKENLSKSKLIRQIIEAIDKKDFETVTELRKAFALKEDKNKETQKKRASVREGKIVK